MSSDDARYVVIVRAPLPADLGEAARRLSTDFDLPVDRANRLLSRAPGPLTRPVPERDARNVASVLRSAGLTVEIRANSVDGEVMEWILPDLNEKRGAAAGAAPYQPHDPALTLAGTTAHAQEPAAPAVAQGSPGAGSGSSGGAGHTTNTYPGPASTRTTQGHAAISEPGGGGSAAGGGPGGAAARPDGRQGDAANGRSDAQGVDPSKTYVPGMTVTTPPRDPGRTTLDRNPPDLERSGLRRRVATAATLPAFLTLLVTLLALVLTLLPLLRAAEGRRAASTANAVAATFEGLSSGLPLTAPLVRVQIGRVAERTAVRLPTEGIDFLILLDSEGLPLMAWYKGQMGLDNVPSGLMTTLEEAVQDRGALRPEIGLLAALERTGRDLLALVGLGAEQPVVALAEVRRAGADGGLVIAGSEGPLQRGEIGWALLTALLVGLIPVLFGVLAAMSLTRGLRDAVLYLLRATDRISHGDLEREVELKRDDELGQIAKAVERMRVSLREAMERLRRR